MHPVRESARVIARRMLLRGVAAALALLAVPAVATAQAYPSKPVTLVVGYAPGGATDTFARILAEKLQARLGQPVLVDNRPGASTIIATNYVRQAPADGHTLYVVTSQFSQMPIVNPTVAKYDPLKDFTVIAPATSMLMVLVANAQLPFSDIKGMLSYAQANPGKLNVATTGIGSTDHMGAELLAYRAGVKFNFIPYKGGAPAVQDVVGGLAQLRLDAMASSRQFIASGKLKALAVFEPHRHPGFPSIASISETVPGVDWSGYIGLIGPKGLPPAVVARLNKEMTDIMKMPEVVARLNTLGLDTVVGTPAQFAASMQRDYDLWVRTVKETGMKLE